MKRLLLACAVLLALPCIAFAGTLPDTGQTKCYDDVGNEIHPCPLLGEPFYGKDANYATCNPHSYTQLDGCGNPMQFSTDYSITPWSMVRDNVTGLMWEVKNSRDSVKDYFNPHDADNDYNWQDARKSLSLTSIQTILVGMLTGVYQRLRICLTWLCILPLVTYCFNYYFRSVWTPLTTIL